MTAAAAAAAARHDTLLPRPPGGLAGGTALALLVHLVLGLALALALNWRYSASETVSAELWAAVPQTAAPGAEERPAPAPRAAPPTPAQAQAQQPAAAPKAERKPLSRDPDIAAERTQQRLQQRQAKADQEQADAERRKRLQTQQQQQQQQREQEAEQQQARLTKARDDQLKRMLGALPAASGAPTSTGSAAQDRAPSQAYAGRLVRRLREALIYATDAGDNPTTEVELRTTPDGTIIARRIVKASGNRDYDDAVLRAIDRVSKLPADTDGRVPPTIAVVFRLREPS